MAVIPLLYELWLRRNKSPRSRFLLQTGAAALTASAGLIAFLVYCWSRFHDPLVFIHARAAWKDSRGLPGGQAAIGQLGAAFHNPALLSLPNLNDGWLFLLFFAITVICWRWMPMSLNRYTTATLLALTVTRICGEPGFISMNRYLLLYSLASLQPLSFWPVRES